MKVNEFGGGCAMCAFSLVLSLCCASTCTVRSEGVSLHYRDSSAKGENVLPEVQQIG